MNIKNNPFLKILRNKTFLKLWLIQSLSQVTANMLNFVLMVHIFSKTNSTISVGLLFAFYMIPTIILGPISGGFVDLWDKKKILSISSLSQALIVLSYLLIGDKIWPIYTIVMFYSFCDEFVGPTIAVLIPSSVPKSELATANAFSMMTGQGAMILGYIFGGLFLRILGPSYVYCFSSLLLLVSVYFSHNLPKTTQTRVNKIKSTFRDFQTHVLEGYRFITKERRVLIPIVMLGIIQIAIGIGIIILPSLSQQVLKINLADAGFAVVIPIVSGALIGSVVTERMLRKTRKKNLITLGLFVSGIAILLFTIAPLVSMHPVLVSLPIAIILGFAFILVNVPLQVLIQEYTPLDIRGRVFGVLGVIISLAATLPSLITATIVDLFGVSVVMIIIGLLSLLTSFYFWRRKYVLVANNHWS